MPPFKHIYEFPNAHIKTYADGRCIEFPKFCMMIHVERSREYVAKALIMLRHHNRSHKKEL